METNILDALREHYPYNQLTNSGLQALSDSIKLYDFSCGEELTHIFNSIDNIFYLIDGQLTIELANSESPEQVSSLIENHIVPLPDQLSDSGKVIAVSDIHLLSINSQMLNKLLQTDQPFNPQVRNFLDTQKQGVDNWREAFLMASGFRHIAKEVIDEAFRRMEPLNVSKGQTIIKQGEISDYFYIITKGRCEVLRETNASHKSVKLVEYGPGASIGEDALLSGQPRNATITMLTDGKLMRLGANDFRFLFALPLTRPIDYSQAKELIANGGRWLDIRMPDEIENNMRLPDSVCIPHPILRTRLLQTDPKYRYVVVCNDGQDSSVMTFVLSKYGFDAFYLEGGLKTVPGYDFSTEDKALSLARVS